MASLHSDVKVTKMLSLNYTSNIVLNLCFPPRAWNLLIEITSVLIPWSKNPEYWILNELVWLTTFDTCNRSSLVEGLSILHDSAERESFEGSARF